MKTGMWVVLGCAWTGSVGLGGVMLFRYESKAGSAGRPAQELRLSTVRYPVEKLAESQLVLTVHPRCACSRATIGELARIMTACQGRLKTTVLMVLPEGKEEGWEKTDLWNSAARIPGVTVVTDVNGEASEKLGAETSGHALLYNGAGKLVFSGGITESRGHAGDNAGESAIISLVSLGVWAQGEVGNTPVYGCSLFDHGHMTAQGGR